MEAEVQVYDNEILKSLSWDSIYTSNLHDLAVRDSGESFGLPSEVDALDVDTYETKQGGNNNKTIDAVIGIADYVANALKNSRLLLVELRTNYTKSGKHSSISEMKKKENYTRSLLLGYRVDQRCFFIFSDEVAPRKHHEINQLSKTQSHLRQWQIVTPNGFMKKFHFVKDLPFVPKTPLEDIRQRCNNYYQSNELSKFIKILEYWYGVSKVYFDQYDLDECVRLSALLNSLIQMPNRDMLMGLSDDMQLDYEILRDDIFQMQIAVENRERNNKEV